MIVKNQNLMLLVTILHPKIACESQDDWDDWESVSQNIAEKSKSQQPTLIPGKE